MDNQKYDGLDSWREEVGIKTTKGETKHYEGGSEYDATADAIRAYNEEQIKKQREFASKLESAYQEVASREEKELNMLSAGIGKFKKEAEVER